jgi:hypothetical protein
VKELHFTTYADYETIATRSHIYIHTHKTDATFPYFLFFFFFSPLFSLSSLSSGNM